MVRDSRDKWRASHPDYQKIYWQTHPEEAARNREGQRQRDQKRRIARLVKNTLVLDLKRSVAEAWLVGPLAGDLVKNPLVPSNLLIVRTVGRNSPPPASS